MSMVTSNSSAEAILHIEEVPGPVTLDDLPANPYAHEVVSAKFLNAREVDMGETGTLRSGGRVHSSGMSFTLVEGAESVGFAAALSQTIYPMASFITMQRINGSLQKAVEVKMTNATVTTYITSMSLHSAQLESQFLASKEQAQIVGHTMQSEASPFQDMDPKRAVNRFQGSRFVKLILSAEYVVLVYEATSLDGYKEGCVTAGFNFRTGKADASLF